MNPSSQNQTEPTSARISPGAPALCSCSGTSSGVLPKPSLHLALPIRRGGFHESTLDERWELSRHKYRAGCPRGTNIPGAILFHSVAVPTLSLDRRSDRLGSQYKAHVLRCSILTRR